MTRITIETHLTDDQRAPLEAWSNAAKAQLEGMGFQMVQLLFVPLTPISSSEQVSDEEQALQIDEIEDQIEDLIALIEDVFVVGQGQNDEVQTWIDQLENISTRVRELADEDEDETLAAPPADLTVDGLPF